MNIDFANDPGFSAYVLLLMVTGIVMVVLASPVVKNSRPWLRLFNILVGLGFFGYGFYLAFLFQGGTYFMLFKAFILPALLVIRTIQGAVMKRRAAVAPVPPHVAAGTPAPYPTFDHAPATQQPQQAHPHG